MYLFINSFQLRAQVSVLKKGVIDEQNNSKSLQVKYHLFLSPSLTLFPGTRLESLCLYAR